MKTILVVDDDEMNLKIARFILEQNNSYSVITASSGMECLTILQTKSVDLILLDIEMPVMNGIKTLEYIREHKEFESIPVMFLTADASENTVITAGRLDIAGYVKKPYMPQDFLERVGKILEA
ncbi:MAG: response regulator [Roseburia sp.]